MECLTFGVPGHFGKARIFCRFFGPQTNRTGPKGGGKTQNAVKLVEFGFISHIQPFLGSKYLEMSRVMGTIYQ